MESADTVAYNKIFMRHTDVSVNAVPAQQHPTWLCSAFVLLSTTLLK